MAVLCAAAGSAVVVSHPAKGISHALLLLPSFMVLLLLVGCMTDMHAHACSSSSSSK